MSDAELISTSSEGVVIEGGNSVTLNNVKLTDTNNTLNGQSTTYKNVFLYQSMSGDAASGGGSFTATDSTITTNKGDSFFVTNNTASITLTNNTIVNNDAEGYFLRAQAGSWGASGSNGGAVTLTLDNQSVTGDIYIDDISALTLILQNGSSFTGKINGDNTAKSIVVTLSADSTITLTGDSYIYSIDNADSTGSNIVAGNYTLTTNAGTAGGASSAISTGSGNSSGFGGQTPPDRPNGEVGMPNDGQTPPDKPDGEGGMPNDGQTPPDKPDGENNNLYIDIEVQSWYNEAVKYVTENSLMTGYGDRIFAPNDAFTRIQLMTVIARADGETISGNDWKEEAKKLAVENGISDGTDIDNEITREQFVTILYRYAEKKGYDISESETGSFDSFNDSSAVSDWAAPAMRWAIGIGLVQGDNNNILPNTTATRAMAAMILMRFNNII